LERAELREVVARRDGGWRCRFCRRSLTCPPAGRSHTRAEAPSLATLDHWVPRARGGTWSLGNLVLACKACNEDKGRLTGHEYLTVLAFRARQVRRPWSFRLVRVWPRSCEVAVVTGAIVVSTDRTRGPEDQRPAPVADLAKPGDGPTEDRPTDDNEVAGWAGPGGLATVAQRPIIPPWMRHPVSHAQWAARFVCRVTAIHTFAFAPRGAARASSGLFCWAADTEAHPLRKDAIARKSLAASGGPSGGQAQAKRAPIPSGTAKRSGFGADLPVRRRASGKRCGGGPDRSGHGAVLGRLAGDRLARLLARPALVSGSCVIHDALAGHDSGYRADVDGYRADGDRADDRGES